MIEHHRDHRFTYATPEIMAPGLVRVTAQNPGPFTFHGTGTFLMGDESLVVIDPGPNLDSHFKALINAIGERSVSHVLVTHRHADHAGLARRLSVAVQAPVYAHARRPAPDNLDGESTTRGFHPDIEIDEGDEIQCDPFKLDVLHTPGHTSDHVCLVESKRRWVFCGDHVMYWSTSVILPPDGHMGAYMASLERMLNFADCCFWPTHGTELKNPEPYLRGLIRHRQNRETAILDTLRIGECTVEELVRKNYPGLADNLVRAAAQSVLAGLIWLQERAQVSFREDLNGIRYYRLH